MASSPATAPFKVGDRVHGVTYVPPDRLRWERPEPFEGDVVQVGSGYAGVDAEEAFVWVRLADHTERRARMADTELCAEVAV
ncbi:hypothetical protein IPZ61_14725 [Streptomyces sioyaensis]|uniref:hypothetical protein n=1 Tax=Streptomyces sioyaensis TaxID=67364 RepID=UPI001F3FF104|nr:hypothetical protein [Streptomyces sioyaensis]MCF3174574.1 hypothetical protein [Streptomyces sioyaensis]